MRKLLETDVNKSPKQHQDFDKILKKKFSRIYHSLIYKLLGFDMVDAVKLPTTFSRTKEKRPDFVAKMASLSASPYLTHVEFQTRNDDKMHKRQLSYYEDLYWAFDLEVLQYVIFLGNGQPTMQTEIKHTNLNFSYKIIVLNQIDVDLFLKSDDLDEVVLAILCKYEKKDTSKIIEKILTKIQQKAKNEREMFEHTTDLEILSGLRKLQSETKKLIDKMPIEYDLTKDLRYKEGKREGKLEGKLEGKEESKREIVIRMLKAKTLSVEDIALFVGVKIDFVKKIQEELKKNPDLK